MVDFAYVAGGRLHVSAGGGPPRVVESSFAESVRERAHDIHRRHSWKGEGSQGGFGALAWGRQPAGPPAVEAQVTGLTRGHGGQFLYSLVVDRLSALCARDLATGIERRLLHGSAVRIRDVSTREGRGIACAVVHADGTASIAVMSPEATDLQEVTEGESLDLHPSWADDGTRRIVYQSAGLGRDAAGRPAGFGRFEIHVLDLDKGEVETIAASADADLERPRIGPDGALHYLSRPHAGPRTGLLAVVKDALLVPVRLVFAIFHYLNFFSARYSGRRLTTAGGPKRPAGDLRRMLEWANLVDAQGTPADEEAAERVPASHKLVRRRADGAPEVLASGVACFDLAADGSVVYATGSAILRRLPSGAEERLCDAVGVESIAAL